MGKVRRSHEGDCATNFARDAECNCSSSDLSLPEVLAGENSDIVLEALGTKEGRGKLIKSMASPARNSLEFTKVKYAAGKRTRKMAESAVRRWLDGMEYVLDRPGGAKVRDEEGISSLMDEMRAFLTELRT